MNSPTPKLDPIGFDPQPSVSNQSSVLARTADLDQSPHVEQASFVDKPQTITPGFKTGSLGILESVYLCLPTAQLGNLYSNLIFD